MRKKPQYLEVSILIWWSMKASEQINREIATAT